MTCKYSINSCLSILYIFIIHSSLNKLGSLTDLNLAGNNILSLPQMALSSMENLQVLNLHSNHLRTIPDLRRMKSLKVN